MLKVSIVVCTFNSNQRIAATLDSLRYIKFSKERYEVIIVNNRSTDSTRSMVDCYIKNYNLENWRIIDETRLGLMYARLCGIQNSKYEIISFVDDDNQVEENWVEVLIDSFERNPEIGILGCESLVVNSDFCEYPDWFSFFSKSYAVGRQVEESNGSSLISNGIYMKDAIWGAGMSIRSQVYKKLNELSFEPILTGRKGISLSAGDDTEICFASRLLGYKIGIILGTTMTHSVPVSRVTEHYLRKLNRGFGAAAFWLKLYRIKAIGSIKTINFIFFLLYVVARILNSSVLICNYEIQKIFSISLINRIKYSVLVEQHVGILFECLTSFNKCSVERLKSITRYKKRLNCFSRVIVNA